MSKLTIYKASAGSGKTYRLTEEYLKLLFTKPESYRNILAVTFTNKATGEMKSRILRQLYLLARSDKLKEKSDHFETISLTFGLDEQQVCEKAKKILSAVLHHYSRFNISTIDRFFHQIIRGFIKEIGLNAGFTVELEEGKVLQQAIDNLMSSIDERTGLRQWLVDFVMEKIDKGKSWDIRNDMLELGQEVFREKYKYFSDDLVKKFDDRESLEAYRKKLFAIKTGFESELKKAGSEAVAIMRRYSLGKEDFKFGASRSIGRYLEDIAKGEVKFTNTVQKAVDTPEEWYKKGSEREPDILEAYNNGLNAQLKAIINKYNEDIVQYNTANEILSYIYMLGILTDISKEIRKYANEKNIFMISDGAKLLYEVINGNETPFIYEKAGNYFNHFMIDEFQDTSHMQWGNFKPLMDNSLAANYDNMIVGDVKQSIYRWRNSDWDILANRINKQFNENTLKTQALDHNYRSKENIIRFNNTFFPAAANMLQQLYNSFIEGDTSIDNEQYDKLFSSINDAYKDVKQKLPNKKGKLGGYIDIEMIPEKEGDGWKNVATSKVPIILEQLQDNGYQLRDIAVLVRKKSEGKEVADYLIDYKNNNPATKYKYDVLSSESLFIGSSSVIQFITGIISFFVFPDDQVNNAYLMHEYKRYIQSSACEKLHEIFNPEMLDEPDKLAAQLSQVFADEWREVRQMPVYEMIERIVSIFALNEINEEIPYLEAFQDVVLEYLSDGIDNIKLFIEWWDENGCTKSIASPEQQDAVNILTVHKAKGLEYKAIIIPYCNWFIDNDLRKTNIIWCEPQEAPFNELKLVPIRYSDQMSNSIFSRDYYHEKLKAYVDNLNLLYVALTRPKEALFAFMPLKEKYKTVKDIAELFYTIIENKAYEQDIIDMSSCMNEDNHFIYGSLPAPKQEDDKIINQEISLAEYATSPLHQRLKLRLYGKDFFNIETGRSIQEQVNYGTVMHEIFQKIRQAKDVEKAVNMAYIEGKLNSEEKDKVIKDIKTLIAREEIKKWFDPTWDIKTETDILIGNGQRIRPDRVLLKGKNAKVIDFKFGETELPVYAKQMQKYKDALYKMGYDDVKGYLWYVELDKIQAV